MKKYSSTSIILTSIFSIGLTSISLAQDNTKIKYNQWKLNIIKAPAVSKLLDFDDKIPLIGITSYQESLHKTKHSISTIKLESPSSVDSFQNEVETLVKPKTEDFLSQALAIIREFEGFRERAYVDTDGTPVIGYGLSKVDGRRVRLGDRISVEKANAVLTKEVLHLRSQVESMVIVELNDSQLSALSSFAFNVGIYGFKGSTLLKKLNSGDYAGAANEFVRWNKAHIKGRKVPLAGLTRRREAEKHLFLK